jgi:hypothetical protein
MGGVRRMPPVRFPFKNGPSQSTESAEIRLMPSRWGSRWGSIDSGAIVRTDGSSRRHYGGGRNAIEAVGTAIQNTRCVLKQPPCFGRKSQQ